MLAAKAEELDEGLFAARHVGAQLHEGHLEVAKVIEAEVFTVRSDGVQYVGRLLRHFGGEVNGFEHSTSRRLHDVNNFQMRFRHG